MLADAMDAADGGKGGIMDKIRVWLSGKKTYLTALAGLLTAMAAWASGELSLMGFLAALWTAGLACFLRSGVTAEVARAVEAVEDEYDAKKASEAEQVEGAK